MLHTLLIFGICGIAGAFIYAFPAYIRAISRKPPVEFALLTLLFSMFVGSVCAAIFTRLIGFHWPWTVEPEPWPLALVIGLASNSLAPIVLRRIETWAETFGGK